MDAGHIKKILEDLADGHSTVKEALCKLRDLPFSDFDVAKHDGHRALRNGFAEVVMCQGKRPEHLAKIVEGLAARRINVLGTRADPEICKTLGRKFSKLDFDGTSRTFKLINREVEPIDGRLAILCAGTADLPVAEEARRTAEFFGIEAVCHYDVGVAGLHRLLSSLDSVRSSDVAVVAAGMEGALPSVLGGLVSIPIVAVPTSVGYGANFGGIAALLSMLNSCSEGITVVNIDNGFGAACAALRILRVVKKTT